MERITDLHSAIDPETSDRRDVLQRPAAGGLINVASVAHPVLRGELVKIGLRFGDSDANGAGGLFLREPARFEERDFYPCRGKDIGGRTADGTAADDGYVGLEIAAMLRIRRAASGRIAVQPIPDAVASLLQGRIILFWVRGSNHRRPTQEL